MLSGKCDTAGLQYFPSRGGANPPKGGANIQFSTNVSKKLHEIEKIVGQVGASVSASAWLHR